MAKEKSNVSEKVVAEQPVAQQQEVVQEAQVQKPVVQEPVKESSTVASVAEIQNIIENPSLSMAEKVNLIVNSKSEATRFAAVMMDYQNAMGKEAVLVSETQGASLNYNLYTRLVKVCKTEEYNDFKVLFDVVNFIFELYKDDAYSEFLLHRFSNKWTWGEKQLKTYQNLITLICVLCNRGNRKQALKTISLTKAFDQDRTVFTEVMINNIRKYYEG